MSNIDDEINVIKKKIQAGHLARARNEAAKETAEASRNDALAKLQAQFGVDNLDDVHAKLAELQAKLDLEKKKINETLEGLDI